MMSLEQAFELALAEARKGAPFVSPNPLVGCVILDANGNFLSKGYHQKYGEAHAEVNALKGLSPESLRGAHVIVTLEPCAHEGKTPSCAKALAKLPIKKVTFGLTDPNPLVAGQGAQILKDAGIEAEELSQKSVSNYLDLKMQLEKVCENFLWNFRQKKVFVALKMASSLDGQIALQSGESQWITGPESREFVHELRASYDAVLVGAGTVEFDNPSLNIRHPGIEKTNEVVVLDPNARLLNKFVDLKLMQVRPADHVFWCVASSQKEQCLQTVKDLQVTPQFIFLETDSLGSFDLPDLMAELYKKGLRSVMIEGGGSTASAFLEAGLVNRLWLFQAPLILGAGYGVSWTRGLKTLSMDRGVRLKYPETLNFGSDRCWTGLLNFHENA